MTWRDNTPQRGKIQPNKKKKNRKDSKNKRPPKM